MATVSQADKDEINRLRASGAPSELSAVFFAALPSKEIASAKTDADGRFAVTLSGHQDAILVAEANRRRPGGPVCQFSITDGFHGALS